MSDQKYKHTGDSLIKTIEECSELIHILCKVRRFGWNNYHPKDKNKTENIKLVMNEITDLQECICLLQNDIQEQIDAIK